MAEKDILNTAAPAGEVRKDDNVFRDGEDILLRVEHLCQYFKLGPGHILKAVDDVSFDIKRGEVFGLVGESGCGKTTTGRSIIRLYDITGGSVYFKGQRICAGTQGYKKALKEAKAKGDKAEAESLKEQIKQAKFDHKNCNKEFARKRVAEVKSKY